MKMEVLNTSFEGTCCFLEKYSDVEFVRALRDLSNLVQSGG
jgi:hypothetical protein